MTDPATLFKQAPMTAHDYMLAAKRDIDELFGQGYAIKHPELVAAYIQTCALDYGMSLIASKIDDIASSLGSIALDIEQFRLKPPCR